VWEVRQSLRAAQQFVAVIVASDYVRRRLREGGVPADLLKTVPYFVEAGERDRPPVRPTTPTPFRVLYIGRLSEVKGIEVLLDAWARADPTWQLVIAGDGYHRAALEARARNLALTNVQFAGYVESDIERGHLYQSSDVVVMPSVWPEPFGIVGLEAMSWGRPVIASDVGGVRDWLADGRVGFLARPDDPDDLERLLRRLAGDPQLRSTLGDQGRAHVQKHFGWHNHWAAFSAALATGGR
jgi:glycosyltransferase involved in cell wall biosynthesis